MKRYIQHEDLKISHFSTDTWQHPEHNHNHFEVIFIHAGRGIHVLNGKEFNYHAPCVFVLQPSDYHHFVVEQTSTFTFLKFTNVYVQSIAKENNPLWNTWIDRLFFQATQFAGGLCLAENQIESLQLSQILLLIVAEWKAHKNSQSQVLQLWIQSFFLLLQPSMSPPLMRKTLDAKLMQVLHYIHENIYDVEKLQAEHLAKEFAYAKTYLGSLFKEKMGMGLKEYISEHKMHLIEHRIKNSDLHFKEISYAFGFSDLSHFNKFFKTHKGISPSAYRKNTQIF